MVPQPGGDSRSAIEANPCTFCGLRAVLKEIAIPLYVLAGVILVGIANTESTGARDETLAISPVTLGLGQANQPPISGFGSGQDVQPSD